MIHRVILAKRAQKQLKKVPKYIANHLLEWIQDVAEYGLEETRKLPGFHDEPLKGKRDGQRSIRLSRSYRAIYVERTGKLDGSPSEIEFVSVEEVNKHDY